MPMSTLDGPLTITYNSEICDYPAARDNKVSFSKLANTLGFAPQWTIEEGISRQVSLTSRNGTGSFIKLSLQQKARCARRQIPHSPRCIHRDRTRRTREPSAPRLERSPFPSPIFPAAGTSLIQVGRAIRLRGFSHRPKTPGRHP